MRLNLIISFILFLAFSFANCNISRGGPPQGLFISVAEWDPNGPSIVEELNYICQYHRFPVGANQSIRFLALTNIAFTDNSTNPFAVPPDPKTNDTLAWDRLEPLLRFFPGGNGSCTFERVFVGSITQDCPGCNGYYEGIQNSTYVDTMLRRQKAVVQEFSSRVAQSSNPNVKWDWYISQEVIVEYFANKAVANGYLDYISRQIIDFNSTRAATAFLWSPFFSENPNNPTYLPGTNGYNLLKNNTKYLFDSIPQRVYGSSITPNYTTFPFWLAQQDHVGLGLVTEKNVTKESAATWHTFLKSIFPFKNLTLNVEQFMYNKMGDGQYPNADCLEVKDREEYYISQNFTLGPSWELHQWYSCNNPKNPRVCDSGWTYFNEHCYKKISGWYNWTQANEICKSNGANLVSIHSKAENDFVRNLDNIIPDSIWIGLSSPWVYITSSPFQGIVNGTVIFKWSDNYPRDYSNWAPGYPAPKENACGAMYPNNGYGRWANTMCNYQAGAFVCKK